MKRIALILLLLALPWKVVEAHDLGWVNDLLQEQENRSKTFDSLMQLGFSIGQEIKEHENKLWAFLDSLYRASRGKECDTLTGIGAKPLDTVRIKHCDSLMLIYDTIPMPYLDDATFQRTYIREIVPLDSVPIVRCYQSLNIYIDTVVCDTIGYRITRERVTETGVE